MKIIFLDFDGVMDTAYYDHMLSKQGLPDNDLYGTVFDPNCVHNLRRIIDNTGADIVVSSSWKHFIAYSFPVSSSCILKTTAKPPTLRDGYP